MDHRVDYASEELRVMIGEINAYLNCSDTGYRNVRKVFIKCNGSREGRVISTNGKSLLSYILCWGWMFL